MIDTMDLKTEQLKKLKMRLFSPEEAALLHGFPSRSSIAFPEEMPDVKRYKLIGNSLNVVVVKTLLDHLLAPSPLSE